MIKEGLLGLLDTLAPRLCPGCDETFEVGVLGFCEVCSPLLDPLRNHSAAYEYGGPMAVAIQKLKYHKRVDLIEILSAMLAEKAREFVGLIDCVIPIPLHPKQYRARGYNQSASLARKVAQVLDVPLELRILVRQRNTLAQAQLNESMRERNMSQAFAVQKSCVQKRILLVDDVRTTGITLAAAAQVLLAHGAKDVRELTLAARR